MKKKNGVFRFYSIKNVTTHTGNSAASLKELISNLNQVEDNSIFHHFHRTFLQHHFLASEFSNDFAVWAKDALQMDALAEKLANVDSMSFNSIAELRDATIKILEHGINLDPTGDKKVGSGKAFHFLSSPSFVFPADISAKNLDEFIKAMQKVSINSLFFHFFVARLRLKRKTNDFSYWIEHSLGKPELARKIERLNPHMYSLDELRKRIIAYCKESL